MGGNESLGEEDLYVILKDSAGDGWKPPIHLGSTINTSGFEIAPFLSDDTKTIYFSSNSHKGLGDADIYSSQRLYNSWTVWTKPENLGENINSPQFDAYLTIAKDSTIYFASNREEGLSDIYQSKLVKQRYDDLRVSNEPLLEDVPRDKKLLKVSESETNKFLGISIPRIVYFILCMASTWIIVEQRYYMKIF